MRNKERGLHPCRPRSRYLRQRGGKGFDFVGRALHNTSSRPYFSFVISTVFLSCHLDFFLLLSSRLSVSAWRDLINAPLAQAASRRDISTTLDMTVGYARNDKGEGTLDMTGGGYARDDIGKNSSFFLKFAFFFLNLQRL